MAIVTLLLCGIFALVLFFTKTNLERESLGMMQSIASDPLRPGRPGETPEGVRLPYFILELDDEGAVVSAEGGYYDLTDEDFLAALASQASGGDVTASWKTTACATAVSLFTERSISSLPTCPASGT